MTNQLPAGLAVSFLVAVSELGWATAARIFVEQISTVLGRAGVEEARDLIGRQYSVFDAVASRWLDVGDVARVAHDAIASELRGARRILIVGAEADALDALVPALGAIPIGLISGGGGVVEDLERVAKNYQGRVEVVPLGDWTAWAGAKSALLTFVYGADAHVANVSPAYLRLVGPDVRASFRSLVGWNLLGPRPRLHPLYLAETSLTDFSIVVGEAGRG